MTWHHLSSGFKTMCLQTCLFHNCLHNLWISYPQTFLWGYFKENGTKKPKLICWTKTKYPRLYLECYSKNSIRLLVTWGREWSGWMHCWAWWTFPVHIVRLCHFNCRTKILNILWFFFCVIRTNEMHFLSDVLIFVCLFCLLGIDKFDIIWTVHCDKFA